MAGEGDEPVVREFDELTLTIEETSSSFLSEFGEQFGDGKERWWFPIDGSMSAEQVDETILDESFVDSVLFRVRVGVVEGEVRDGFGSFWESKGRKVDQS